MVCFLVVSLFPTIGQLSLICLCTGRRYVHCLDYMYDPLTDNMRSLSKFLGNSSEKKNYGPTLRKLETKNPIPIRMQSRRPSLASTILLNKKQFTRNSVCCCMHVYSWRQRKDINKLS